jgi:hypothetical protein
VSAELDASAQRVRPRTVFTPKKSQKMVYAKGKPVYELVDPDRNVHVLQAILKTAAEGIRAGSSVARSWTRIP